MALPLLNHFNLTIHSTFSQMASHLPIVLPTLHFLCLESEGAAIIDIIRFVQADSFIAFYLGGWVDKEEEESTIDDQTELHFPSLQHLIFNKDLPDLDVFARTCHKIKHLTIGARCDLMCMCTDTQDNEGDGESCSDDWERWPSLQVLVVSGFNSPILSISH